MYARSRQFEQATQSIIDCFSVRESLCDLRIEHYDVGGLFQTRSVFPAHHRPEIFTAILGTQVIIHHFSLLHTAFSLLE